MPMGTTSCCLIYLAHTFGLYCLSRLTALLTGSLLGAAPLTARSLRHYVYFMHVRLQHAALLGAAA